MESAFEGLFINSHNHRVPSPVFMKACEKLQVTCSVCDRKEESKKNMLTEEKVQDIQTLSEISPHKLL
jgi:hypothetical protein